MNRTVGRIEGRIEQFLTHQAEHTRRIDNHEHRISTLENKDSARKGGWKVAAVIASVATAATAWAADLLGLLHR